MYFWLVSEVDNSDKLLVRQAKDLSQFKRFKKNKCRVYNFFKENNIDLTGLKISYFKSIKNIEEFELTQIN